MQLYNLNMLFEINYVNVYVYANVNFNLVRKCICFPSNTSTCKEFAKGEKQNTFPSSIQYVTKKASLCFVSYIQMLTV